MEVVKSEKGRGQRSRKGHQSTRLRLVGKRIRSSKKIEWIQLCSLRFPKPRLRLQTERVGSDFGGEGCSISLSRSDGGSCPNKRNADRRNAISIYIWLRIPSLQQNYLPPFQISFQPQPRSFWNFAQLNPGLPRQNHKGKKTTKNLRRKLQAPQY